MTATTVERQAPAALLALVQHINEHGLGAPLSIQPATTQCPYFSLAVVADSLDAWVTSGLTVETETIETRANPVRSTTKWERVQWDGLLQPHGIRVQLLAYRAVPKLAAVPA